MQFKLHREVFCIALFTFHYSLFFLHLKKCVAIAAA